MTSTCETIVERIGTENSLYSSKTFESLIKKLMKSSKVISRLDIITNEDSGLDYEASNVKFFRIPNNGTLAKIMSKVLASKDEMMIILKVDPAYKSHLKTDGEANSFSYNSQSSLLRMELIKSSYQSVPNLSRFGVVKKRHETKKGHGNREYISWTHSIEISIAEHSMPAEVMFAIEKVFDDGIISVSTIDVDASVINDLLMNEHNNIDYTTHESMNIEDTIPSSLYDIGDLEDSSVKSDLYEYLTMASLSFSGLLEDQDSYISSFRAPAQLTGVKRRGLTRRISLKNIHPSWVASVWHESWSVISIFITGEKEEHILVYNDPKFDSLITWVCR